MLFLFIKYISAFFGIVAALMIFNFKHLQTHPNKLIAWALIYGSVLDL